MASLRIAASAVLLALSGAAICADDAEAQLLTVKTRIWEISGICGKPNLPGFTSDLIAMIPKWTAPNIMIVSASADFIFTEGVETATLFVGNASSPDPVTPMRWLPASKDDGAQRQLTSEHNFAAGQGMPMTDKYLDVHMPCLPAEAAYAGSLTIGWVETP